MSGICGIVAAPGQQVDSAALKAMTDAMRFRGPDGHSTWSVAQAALGHTLLQTDACTPPTRQPATLDGRCWITADARIDDRQELTRQLKRAGQTAALDCDDALLILHAYRAWGTDCAQHLLGDFSFAIWDSEREHLFCARDHFGIKPFFYARTAHGLVFSNTLVTVRQHPAVSPRLDELAIADFLLFGSAEEPGGTAFADIRRLPAGHAMVYTPGQAGRIWRYWALEQNLGTLNLPRHAYVDAFVEQLERAVADRLRTQQLGLELSGGMDSTSLAAIARRLLQRSGRPFDLRAQCCVFDQWIPDEERHFASLAAQHLGIPLDFIVGEHHRLLDQPTSGFHPPEPVYDLQPTRSAACFEGAAQGARVWLTGVDGDALLSESIRPHLAHLREQKKYGEIARALVSFVWTQRHLLRWRPLFMQPPRNPAQNGAYPAGLNPALEERLGLRERWESRRAFTAVSHPTRPYAYTVLNHLAQTGRLFDGYDAGATGQPLEYRHPLMDLRLMRFCLALPLQPWVTKKYILRESMKACLPRAIVRRPKTTLAGFPAVGLLQRDAPGGLLPHVRDERIATFVTDNGSLLPNPLTKAGKAGEAPDVSPLMLRTRILDQWLAGVP